MRVCDRFISLVQGDGEQHILSSCNLTAFHKIKKEFKKITSRHTHTALGRCLLLKRTFISLRLISVIDVMGLEEDAFV